MLSLVQIYTVTWLSFHKKIQFPNRRPWRHFFWSRIRSLWLFKVHDPSVSCHSSRISKEIERRWTVLSLSLSTRDAVTRLDSAGSSWLVLLRTIPLLLQTFCWPKSLIHFETVQSETNWCRQKERTKCSRGRNTCILATAPCFAVREIICLSIRVFSYGESLASYSLCEIIDQKSDRVGVPCAAYAFALSVYMFASGRMCRVICLMEHLSVWDADSITTITVVCVQLIRYLMRIHLLPMALMLSWGQSMDRG